MSTFRWWATLVIGTAAALLIAWLAHVAGVPLRVVLVIVASSAALGWLIMLVTVPWSLYFSARQVVAEMAISRERGITVAPARQTEAARIARRLLRIAIGAHAATAVATVVITYLVGGRAGYYLAGFYLLSAVIRPAAAYLGHVRGRISALSVESLHPRQDVAALRQDHKALAGRVEELAAMQREVASALSHAESRLADDIAHARHVLTADLARVQDAQAAGQDAARAREEVISRRVDAMVRQVEQTLDGISDHQEVQAGLRALIRMIRQDAAGDQGSP
jgi:hypothetical protein